ncbi:hypothetical protein AAG906_020980 [Vitis piasezkii]
MLEDDVRAPLGKSWLRTGIEWCERSAKISDRPRSSSQRQENKAARNSHPSHPFPYPMRRAWSHNGDVQEPPLFGREAHKAGHLKQYLRSDARDGTIIFPLVDPTRILQPRDASSIPRDRRLDVRRILVDWTARPILYKHRSLATWAQSNRPRKPR